MARTARHARDFRNTAKSIQDLFQQLLRLCGWAGTVTTPRMQERAQRQRDKVPRELHRLILRTIEWLERIISEAQRPIEVGAVVLELLLKAGVVGLATFGTILDLAVVAVMLLGVLTRVLVWISGASREPAPRMAGS